MRIIFNKDAPKSADTTRRAVVSDLTFKVITGPQSTRERKLWGKPVNLTKGEWAAQLVSVNENRKALGLPAVPQLLTETQVRTIGAQIAAGITTGASKADVDAAARTVIEKIPTKLI